ncbi:MAG: hypothetical protein IKB22_00200 [Lentisphaeria bacterium]|nr:hypothetical protein [Lentisphaeria bacterium]
MVNRKNFQEELAARRAITLERPGSLRLYHPTEAVRRIPPKSVIVVLRILAALVVITGCLFLFI